MPDSRIGIAIRGLTTAVLLAPGIAMAATPVTYSAQLSWTVPTQRDNGQALPAAELSGYEIYYTADEPARSGSLKVNGGASASATVPNLAAGKYYFTIAAIDRAGLKSPLSNVVTGQIGAAQNPAGTGSTGGVNTGAAANANYSVSLSWSVPTQRVNGKALSQSQLAGYELRYVGGTPMADKVVRITGGANSRYVATGLTPGTYLFRIAAIDTSGVSSVASNTIIKVIKAPAKTAGGSGDVAGGSTAGGAVAGSGSGSASPAGGTTVAGGGTAGTGATAGGGGTKGGTNAVPISYTAQLSWDIPSQRENGRPLPLSELAGYEVYYTADNPALSGSIKVNGGGTGKVAVPNLASGQYYFSIAAIDTEGLKSALSAVLPVRLGY